MLPLILAKLALNLVQAEKVSGWLPGPPTNQLAYLFMNPQKHHEECFLPPSSFSLFKNTFIFVSLAHP